MGKSRWIGWASVRQNTPVLKKRVLIKSNYLYTEGKYSESLKLKQVILEHYKQSNEPWRIFLGILNILEFHNSRYTATKEEKYLEETKNTYQDLIKFSSEYPENQIMQNYVLKQ